MAIQYPDETSGWEKWQLEYRYGGFYLFPPSGIIEVVDELRRTYDPPSYAICQAHVTLTEPLPRALTNEDLAELSAVLADLDPFTVTYGDVHATVPHPGVVYRIEPAATIVALRQAIHATSLFADAPLSHEHVPPHMTIAEFITLDESIVLAASLAGQVEEGEWPCHAIDYAVPDNDMRFHRALSLLLGTPS